MVVSEYTQKSHVDTGLQKRLGSGFAFAPHLIISILLYNYVSLNYQAEGRLANKGRISGQNMVPYAS
jgi:hypothetical protein